MACVSVRTDKGDEPWRSNLSWRSPHVALKKGLWNELDFGTIALERGSFGASCSGSTSFVGSQFWNDLKVDYKQMGCSMRCGPCTWVHMGLARAGGASVANGSFGKVASPG